MQFSELQKRIQNANEVDFGSIIDDVFKLFKEVWLKGFLAVLIIMIVAIAFGFLFGLLGLGADPFTFDTGFEINWYDFISNNALYSLPQTIVVSCFTIAIVAGFYRVCKQIDLGENESDDLFYFLGNGQFTKVLSLGAIYAVIATVAQLLLVIPYIYAFVPLSFFSIILAFNPEMTEIEIVKSSFNLGNKKWLITFGTMFVCGIIGMLGIIACGIGVLFTMSIVYLPVYFIYKNAIGFDEHKEIDLIGTE